MNEEQIILEPSNNQYHSISPKVEARSIGKYIYFYML
jgi:hypothetical protein